MPSSDDRYSAYDSREPEYEGPGPVGYLALVVAWAVPGLGHIVLGEKGRGLIFGFSIVLLFAAGMLVGGIRAINPTDQPIWTYTQFLAGAPMLAANYFQKRYFEPEYVALPPRDPPIEQEYKTELHEKGVGVNDYSAAGIETRKTFTTDFIASHPLFAIHPKVQDMGAVYCGIAGMLNLLVMFDVLLRITGSVREDTTALKKRGSALGNMILQSAEAMGPRGKK